MRCPNCKKEIDNNAKYCPYCGKKITIQNKDNALRKNILLFVVVTLCVSLVSYNVINGLMSGTSLASRLNTSSTLSSNTLGEISGSATKVVATYDSLQDFNNAYTNAQTYSLKVLAYNSELESVLGSATSTKCTVKVLDNNNVVFYISNTYYKESMTIKVKRQFAINNEIDTNKYIFKTDVADNFDALFFTENQKSIIGQFASIIDVSNIEEELHTRKDEFEEKKDNIGHYGLGIYDSTMSNVIKKQDDLYYKVLIVK